MWVVVDRRPHQHRKCHLVSFRAPGVPDPGPKVSGSMFCGYLPSMRARNEVLFELSGLREGPRTPNLTPAPDSGQLCNWQRIEISVHHVAWLRQRMLPRKEGIPRYERVPYAPTASGGVHMPSSAWYMRVQARAPGTPCVGKKPNPSDSGGRVENTESRAHGMHHFGKGGGSLRHLRSVALVVVRWDQGRGPRGIPV